MKTCKWVKIIVAAAFLTAGFWNVNFLSGAESGEYEEFLWDGCEAITATWNPEVFKDVHVGTVSIDNKEKVEGEGSIHWVVTEEEIRKSLEEKKGMVAIHKSYRNDWSPYIELKFSVKCENPNGPDIFVQLQGAYEKPPGINILKRGEVTNGWKEISWDLTSHVWKESQYGKIMNYFRIYTSPSWYEKALPIDIYIDNIRLVTKKAAEVE